MMSNTMDKDNRGERSVARRTRQRWLIKAVMIGWVVAFAATTLFLVPTGADANGSTIAVGLIFLVGIAAMGWMAWQRIDEIQRRLAVNALATMGVVCIFLLPVSHLLGRALGVTDPSFIVIDIALIVGLAVHTIQRFRG